MSADVTEYACMCKGNIKQYRKIFIHPHLFTGFRHALNLHEECTVFEKKTDEFYKMLHLSQEDTSTI